jgi:prepilin-type N-terminal cleavage/methylation domain-containing protein
MSRSAFYSKAKGGFTPIVDLGEVPTRVGTSKSLSPKFTTGFTLIELLVVVAIIGILSSVVISSLNTSRAKARDIRRKSDLHQIRTVLAMYFNERGDYIENGSGCGYGGNGYGWFNSSGGSYPKSIMQCLIEAGVANQEIIDPTGYKSGSSPTNSYHAYMKYTCGSPVKTYVYAKLESIPQSSTATDGTCCATCDSSYGMNYYVSIE